MLRPIEIEMIRADVADFTKRKIKAGQFGRVFTADDGILRTKKASDWMKQEYGKPAARMLFGGFWHEHELCILFADTNLGKSILAVQIANSLTKAVSIGPFNNQQTKPQGVLYVDFELSAKQFEARYVSPQWGSYLFADGFYRAEFNAGATTDVLYNKKHYNQEIENAITVALQQTGAGVLIIDNITYMRDSSAQVGNIALDLMKMLKALKVKHNLSILALAHTPKRGPYKSITVNDLQGSKMLMNFADSAFAIGQSHTTPGLRYLKQIKQRNQQQQYSENNICLISLENKLNFLQYKFEGHAAEHEHICKPARRDREQQIQEVLQLHRQGLRLRKIAAALNMHFTTVGRILKKHQLNEEEEDDAKSSPLERG